MARKKGWYIVKLFAKLHTDEENNSCFSMMLCLVAGSCWIRK